MTRRFGGRLFASGLVLVAMLPQSGGLCAQPNSSTGSGQVFASVNDKTITVAEYQQALAAGMRQKFYHSKPPESEIAQFRRQVGEQVVNRVLLLAEASRRGTKPDRTKIDQTIADYDKRYQNSEQWKVNRERMLAAVVGQLEAQSILERLEQQVRRTDPPAATDVRKFYAANPPLFTEPEQFKISLILLRVDPSSPRVVWEKAREEAARLHRRLVAGADFAETARTQSGDPSADKGGDLGYLHRGMLPEPIQQQLIDSLKVGTIAPPVQLLEGMAIVRLDDTRAARLRAFDEVATRAGELLQRERGDKAWQQLIVELRGKAVIKVDESRYQPLAAK